MTTVSQSYQSYQTIKQSVDRSMNQPGNIKRRKKQRKKERISERNKETKGEEREVSEKGMEYYPQVTVSKLKVLLSCLTESKHRSTCLVHSSKPFILLVHDDRLQIHYLYCGLLLFICLFKIICFERFCVCFGLEEPELEKGRSLTMVISNRIDCLAFAFCLHVLLVVIISWKRKPWMPMSMVVLLKLSISVC